MVRTVVFHHNQQVRERVVDAFRQAGIITYDAVDPQHAFTAAWTYHPHVVITDYPAVLESGRQSRTLTQAIRESPALHDVAVLNLGGDGSDAAIRDAARAGATATLPPSTPPAEIIRAINEMSRRGLRSSGDGERD